MYKKLRIFFLKIDKFWRGLCESFPFWFLFAFCPFQCRKIAADTPKKIRTYLEEKSTVAPILTFLSAGFVLPIIFHLEGKKHQQNIFFVEKVYLFFLQKRIFSTRILDKSWFKTLWRPKKMLSWSSTSVEQNWHFFSCLCCRHFPWMFFEKVTVQKVPLTSRLVDSGFGTRTTITSPIGTPD